MKSIEELLSIKDSFILDLKSGSSQTSSLPFIINQLPSDPVIEVGEKFQVVSIGGTNYRVAHVSLGHDGKLLMEKHEYGERPFFSDKESFLIFLTSIIDPHVEYLGLNFAFPMRPVFRNGLIDGELMQATKNDQFEGLVSEMIGKEIEYRLGNGIKVSVANDTICLLMAGTQNVDRLSIGAFIVGTGYNASFFMDNTHAVNIEAANFSKFKQSEKTQRINESAQNKGSLFEKEVSGAYLYQHFNLAGGVHRQIESSEALDQIAKNESDPDCEIARSIFEHSAQLVSTHISGIMEYKQSDMHFIMQGSIYWNAWNYKESVELWVKKLCPQFTAQFFEVEDADLWGAAHLLV